MSGVGVNIEKSKGGSAGVEEGSCAEIKIGALTERDLDLFAIRCCMRRPGRRSRG
jgi:hypothetical protein